VEPDPVRRIALGLAGGRLTHIDVCSSFQSARALVAATAYDLLVTNVRLEAYNGLHLVFLAKFAHAQVHAVVYDDRVDLGLASQVQRAGAFYEAAHRLPITLPAYVGAPLPAADRRTPAVFDRRMSARGGRRRWDVHLLSVA
jgi:DNA-binding NtrC family response regulator